VSDTNLYLGVPCKPVPTAVLSIKYSEIIQALHCNETQLYALNQKTGAVQAEPDRGRAIISACPAFSTSRKSTSRKYRLKCPLMSPWILAEMPGCWWTCYYQSVKLM
jgi:hypothetical protein